MAGIPVFAGVGVGGILRGYFERLDIPPDVEEMACQPVSVACTSPKLNFDFANDLEVLEARRVPEIGHESDRFPAYYTTSIFATDKVEGIEAIAGIMAVKCSLGVDGGGSSPTLCQGAHVRSDGTGAGGFQRCR